uniref:ThiF domain-containing protein n=1 Tax=Schistocephalus solidus TaxID=70667 RepID=A0A183SB78_SCHSO
LDTIDVSNLNRQFLFRKEHVGKSKAEVAGKSIKCFRDDVNLKAYHASIFSLQFGPEFFEEFDIVFNALDNQAARRHVNRMCVNIGKAVIESGTSGYLGQVEPLLFKSAKSVNGRASNALAGRASCFECQPVENDRRSYPTCTIRNTPSEPIHCVVWAKFLFNQLFGIPDIEDEDISPDMEDPENTASQIDSVNLEKQVKPNSSNLPLWERVKLDKLASQSIEEALAWRLFHTDVLTLTSMRSLWENRPERKQPDPLDHETLAAALTDPGLDCVSSDTTEGAKLRDQRKLNLIGWLSVFIASCRALRKRTGFSNDQPSSAYSAISWDKVCHITQFFLIMLSRSLMQYSYFYLQELSIS